MHNSRYSKCMDHTVIKAQKISKTIMSEWVEWTITVPQCLATNQWVSNLLSLISLKAQAPKCHTTPSFHSQWDLRPKTETIWITCRTTSCQLPAQVVTYSPTMRLEITKRTWWILSRGRELSMEASYPTSLEGACKITMKVGRLGVATYLSWTGLQPAIMLMQLLRVKVLRKKNHNIGKPSLAKTTTWMIWENNFSLIQP